jgi:hypothetical protein
MLLQQYFQQLGDLTPAFAATDENNRLTGMVVDRSDAVTLFGLGERLDHHLLAHRGPHRLESGYPTQVELVGVVEVLSRSEVVAGFFDRLF